jgi:hypothetical protein
MALARLPVLPPAGVQRRAAAAGGGRGGPRAAQGAGSRRPAVRARGPAGRATTRPSLPHARGPGRPRKPRTLGPAQARHSAVLRSHHRNFHPVWGQLMKTGHQNSRFAHQVPAPRLDRWDSRAPRELAVPPLCSACHGKGVRVHRAD